MDGTFGGGDLISASLAIMLGESVEAELNDKEVELSTSDSTGSQTAVFEYDPQDEDPQGDPPGPWDGYSLFTIDLTSVKTDINALKAKLAAMLLLLKRYNPDFDPDEDDPVEELEDDINKLVVCDETCEQAVETIQKYIPNFDPVDCSDVPPAIDDVYDKGEEDAPDEYTFDYTNPDDPTDPDPTPVLKLVGGDPVESNGVTCSFYFKFFPNGGGAAQKLNPYNYIGGDNLSATGEGSGYFAYTVNGTEYQGSGGQYVNMYTGFHLISMTPTVNGIVCEYEYYFYYSASVHEWRRGNPLTLQYTQGWGTLPYTVHKSS